MAALAGVGLLNSFSLAFAGGNSFQNQTTDAYGYQSREAAPLYTSAPVGDGPHSSYHDSGAADAWAEALETPQIPADAGVAATPVHTAHSTEVATHAQAEPATSAALSEPAAAVPSHTVMRQDTTPSTAAGNNQPASATPAAGSTTEPASATPAAGTTTEPASATPTAGSTTEPTSVTSGSQNTGTNTTPTSTTTTAHPVAEALLAGTTAGAANLITTVIAVTEAAKAAALLPTTEAARLQALHLAEIAAYQAQAAHAGAVTHTYLATGLKAAESGAAPNVASQLTDHRLQLLTAGQTHQLETVIKAQQASKLVPQAFDKNGSAQNAANVFVAAPGSTAAAVARAAGSNPLLSTGNPALENRVQSVGGAGQSATLELLP